MGKRYRSPSLATTSGSIASVTGMTKGQKIKFKTKRKAKACATFMYNKNNKTFCHRTCKSWALVLLFYLLFVGILLGSFFGLIYAITRHIKEHATGPHYNKQDLIPNGSPGLSIFPKMEEGLMPLIWYVDKGKDNSDPKHYIKYIDNYFKPYKNQKNTTYVECTESNPPKVGELCSFDMQRLGPCGENGYGYNEAKPCIYLKLNKLQGWVPKSYKDCSQLPSNIPDSIANQVKQGPKKQIWVDCDGIKDFDKQHKGEMKYYPHQGIETVYFPYEGSPHYLMPIVGVQLLNLTRGYLLGLRCSLWARNMKMDDAKSHSSVVYIFLEN